MDKKNHKYKLQIGIKLIFKNYKMKQNELKYYTYIELYK